jgi:outer membrane lipoprotein SlyB
MLAAVSNGLHGALCSTAKCSQEIAMFADFAIARRCGLTATAAAAVLLAGCATPQPVVYQKTTAGAIEQRRVVTDTQDCRRRAEAAVGLNARRADAVAQSTAKTGAVAFAATAVAGLVGASKDAWQRARAGAAGGATGAAVKVLLEWNDPDKVHEEYVERCMSERGHDVLGWR